MLPTWVVSLLQAGRITRYTAIIETPAGGVERLQCSSFILQKLEINADLMATWLVFRWNY